MVIFEHLRGLRPVCAFGEIVINTCHLRPPSSAAQEYVSDVAAPSMPRTPPRVDGRTGSQMTRLPMEPLPVATSAVRRVSPETRFIMCSLLDGMRGSRPRPLLFDGREPYDPRRCSPGHRCARTRHSVPRSPRHWPSRHVRSVRDRPAAGVARSPAGHLLSAPADDVGHGEHHCAIPCCSPPAAPSPAPAPVTTTAFP